MPKQYQWRATTTFQTVAPNTSLTSGAIPATEESWQTADIGTPFTITRDYYYHDANNTNVSGWFTDDNSTRVRITIEQTWNTSVDAYNNVTVSISTKIGPIVRDDKRGVCADTPGRQIEIYTQDSGSPVISIIDNQVGTERTLQGTVTTIPTYTITITPGAQNEQSSVYIHDTTIGLWWYDDIWSGVQFKNILPADYRPGAINDTLVWQSHNRPAGNSHTYDGTKFIEMRTIGAPTEKGTPPSIMNNNIWFNMNKIGKDANV